MENKSRSPKFYILMIIFLIFTFYIFLESDLVKSILINLGISREDSLNVSLFLFVISLGLIIAIVGRVAHEKSSSVIEEGKRKLKIDQYSYIPNGAVRVEDVFEIIGVGVIPVGEVIEGNIKPGYVCNRMDKQIEIKTIEMHHGQIEIAVPGDRIGFNVKGVSKSDIKKGEILYFHEK